MNTQQPITASFPASGAGGERKRKEIPYEKIDFVDFRGKRREKHTLSHMSFA